MFGEDAISSAPVTMTPLGNQWTFFTETTNPSNGATSTSFSAQATRNGDLDLSELAGRPGLCPVEPLRQRTALGGETAGQWIDRGIRHPPALITPNETGYSSGYGGTFMYSNTTCWSGGGSTCKNTSTTGMQVGACTPGSDYDCLLPTWDSRRVGRRKGHRDVRYEQRRDDRGQSGETHCDGQIGNGGFGKLGNGANWTTSYAQTHGQNQGATTIIHSCVLQAT